MLYSKPCVGFCGWKKMQAVLCRSSLQVSAVAGTNFSTEELHSVAIHQCTHVQACCACYCILLNTCAGMLLVVTQLCRLQGFSIHQSTHVQACRACCHDLMNIYAGMLHVVPCADGHRCRPAIHCCAHVQACCWWTIRCACSHDPVNTCAACCAMHS